MTSPTPVVDTDAVRHIASNAFVPTGTGTGTGGVGIEMEWLVFERSDPAATVRVHTVRDAVGQLPLPAGGAVSFEPGGQLELSTRRHDSPGAALAALDHDATELRNRVESAGLRLVELGLDPLRPPVRSLDLPRYAAMERAFDTAGVDGRLMMCSTASIQINVDFGPDPWLSWQTLGSVAPVLGAAFANSPWHLGAGTGLASARAGIWSRIDPTRTGPVPTRSIQDWTDYVLDARVLLIRVGDGATAVTDGMTLQTWVGKGHQLGFPDAADVSYHLTTLFPPIRPRGWLELRMIDALPPLPLRVAVATAWAVATFPSEFTDVANRCADTPGLWSLVPRGLTDPGMRACAVDLFATAAEVVTAAELIGSTGPPLADEITRWLTTMVRPGRTPAVEAQQALQAWRTAAGWLFPFG